MDDAVTVDAAVAVDAAVTVDDAADNDVDDAADNDVDDADTNASASPTNVANESNKKQYVDHSSSLEIMMRELSKNSGCQVDFKRKLPDGSYQDAPPDALSLLSVKSKIATTAEAMKGASNEERTSWAIEMKDYANCLYSEKKYKDAMDKYVEALTASNFGGNSSSIVNDDKKGAVEVGLVDGVETIEDGCNIDVLVLPILTNLAACCIQMELWGKAIRFCDQALLFRPLCAKAYMRRGIAFLHLGEFSRAKEDLDHAYKISTDTTDTGNNLSYIDQQRLLVFAAKALDGSKKEKDNEEKRKYKLRKLFDKNNTTTTTTTTGNVAANRVDNDDSNRDGSATVIGTFHRFITFIINWIYSVLQSVKATKIA